MFRAESVPKRLKPTLQNKPFIAAVNRCATQNQARYRLFPQAVKPCPSQTLEDLELLGSPRRGEPRLYTSFSEALKLCSSQTTYEIASCEAGATAVLRRFVYSEQPLKGHLI